LKNSLLGRAVLGGVLAALAMNGDVLACGDKLVVVGRGLRANRVRGASQRASILLYADPKSGLASALEEGHLRKDLERAGHRLRSATSKEDLESALSTGTYDLLLADYKATPMAESEAKGSASKPTVLPTLFNPTDAELAAASHQYNCVMKAPSEQKDYMAVINEALAERAKQASAAAKK
jgi:DNA-binding NtrC family response regulator